MWLVVILLVTISLYRFSAMPANRNKHIGPLLLCRPFCLVLVAIQELFEYMTYPELLLALSSDDPSLPATGLLEGLALDDRLFD